MEAAPFYGDVSDAPEGTVSAWLEAVDGVKIRAAYWRGGTKGTVLLFPGRTEYIEKYGPAAREFAARGYSMATLDWRGQGIADRLLADRAPGHVRSFADYQLDLAAFTAFLKAEHLPEPWFLVAHSMGGCIGLRAIQHGLPVGAVVFSGPMWGIQMPNFMRPVAWSVSSLAPLLRQTHRYVPATSPVTYVLASPFEENLLTRDPEMYDFMRRQMMDHPDLAIGGPTLGWLREALIETRALAFQPSPKLPCLTVLGGSERIVDVQAIRARMARWPGGHLDVVPEAEHEVMMEVPATRKRFYDAAAALFDSVPR